METQNTWIAQGQILPLTEKKERKKYLKEAEEAIKICQLAINYGLKDDTKGGFEGRIDRLKKKANKKNRQG